MGVVVSAGDNREEEITPYLKRSAKACVRRDKRCEEKNELRDCNTFVTLWAQQRAMVEVAGKKKHVCC